MMINLKNRSRPPRTYQTKSIYLAICNGKRDPDDQVVVRDFITMEIGVPSGALPDMGPEGLNDETIIRSLKGEQGEASAHSVLSLNILTGATGYETNWGVKYDEAKVRTVAYKENAMRYGDFDGGTIEAMTSKNLARVLADLKEGVDRLASV